MKLLLIKQNILILQCLCTIELSIVIIILIHLVVYGRDELNVDVINTVLAKIMLLHLSKKPVLLVILVQMEEKNGIKIAVPLKYLSNFWR